MDKFQVSRPANNCLKGQMEIVFLQRFCSLKHWRGRPSCLEMIQLIPQTLGKDTRPYFLDQWSDPTWGGKTDPIPWHMNAEVQRDRLRNTVQLGKDCGGSEWLWENCKMYVVFITAQCSSTSECEVIACLNVQWQHFMTVCPRCKGILFSVHMLFWIKVQSRKDCTGVLSILHL